MIYLYLRTIYLPLLINYDLTLFVDYILTCVQKFARLGASRSDIQIGPNA